jgi:putative DNA primase/helicase
MSEFIDFDLVEAERALNYCDYGDRDEWVQMGMALRSEFGDAAFDIWDAWSAQDKSYKPNVARQTWRSFKGIGITIGTLISRAKDLGFEFERPERSEEDKKRIEKERQARLKAREEQEKQEELEEQQWREKVSEFLTDNLDKFSSEGYSKYLQNKQCPPFGLLYPTASLIIVVDREKDRLEMHYGTEPVRDFFKSLDGVEDDDKPSFRYLKKGGDKGVVVVPMVDIDGKLWNFQLLYSDGGKAFLKDCKKSGCFHVLGAVPTIGKFNVCMVEGYSNGAPIHMALGCPVVVAFDAGNLANVAMAWKERLGDRISRFAICGDDDVHLTEQGKKNAGRVKAIQAAKAVGGITVFPDMGKEEKPEPPDENEPAADLLYEEAIEIIRETKKAVVSHLQRRLKIGYNRAARMIEQMERDGIVSEPGNGGRREVLNVKE